MAVTEDVQGTAIFAAISKACLGMTFFQIRDKIILT